MMHFGGSSKHAIMSSDCFVDMAGDRTCSEVSER